MRILIAEDDPASRKYLSKLLSRYGECDLTIDGIETYEAFVIAHDLGKPYELLCLDIMMPKIDGLKALKAIRDFEKKKGIDEDKRCKVVIISALSKTEVEFDSFSLESDVFLTKPVNIDEIKEAIGKLGLFA